LCDVYARLFSQARQQARPELRADELIARYRRVRRPPSPPEDVRRVYVLSRVTLGADVAATSVLLDAMKRRYPAAEICFVGSRKGWEIFAGDPRIRHVQSPYARTGTLVERLAAGFALRDALAGEDAIVADPDSRLTQLGLLPVCDEERYFFFESRSFGGDGEDAMPVLAARWAEQTFGVRRARPYVAPKAGELHADITVSLGVGENPAKRIGDPFEAELLRTLAATGRTVLVDKGGSEEESARVERAVAACGGQVRTWQGAFAPFAAAIAGSRLYVGYDSAGQHVAAASGVPLVTIFAGFPSERMFQRWRPHGPGPMRVVRVDDPEPERVLEKVRRAIGEFHFP
ncbi:MAG: glycosyltransferase family 9 protein, partial [Bryobacteraceae bacterium]